MATINVYETTDKETGKVWQIRHCKDAFGKNHVGMKSDKLYIVTDKTDDEVAEFISENGFKLVREIKHFFAVPAEYHMTPDFATEFSE